MFGFEIPGAETVVAMLLDVSIKATLLTVAAWATVALFRVRSVTIKHRVWSLVLFSMLLLPALIRMAPVVAVPVSWSVNPVGATFPDRTADEQAGEMPSISPVADIPHDPGTVSEQETNLVASASSAETITENEATQPVNFAVPIVPPVNPVVLNTVAPVRRMSFLFAVALIYAVGVTGLLARILIGMIQCNRLIHHTHPVVFPNNLHLPTTTARIMESNQVLVPLTLGLWHPVIVLPTDWKTWDESLLGAAIAHEAEHVRRRDTWVALITTFNTALYWFHPLSWLLRRHITELAEQACDDEVIRTTGQRTAYAQILVEMATRLATGSRRYQPAGIGMAKTPFVELRVSRILDSNRPLAGQLSTMFSAMLISSMAVAATITAGLSSAPAVAATQELKVAPTPAQPVVADPVNGNLKTDPQVIEGRVVMADDSPVADAEVRMMTWAGTTRYKTTTTKTNERGEFRIDEFGEGKHRVAAYVYDQDLASRIERYKGDVAEPGEKTVVLKLQKVPALKVTTLSAETSQPITGARVRLTWTDIERDYPTDAKGEVTIHGLTPEAWTIEVQAKGFAEQVHTVNLTGSETGEVTAALEPGAELSGIVRNESGEILPDAGVSVFPSGMRGEQIEYMVTNDKGEYRFEYMPIGAVQLLVSKDDYQRLQQEVVVSVAAGERQKQDLTLVRRPDGGSIQGTVVNTAGSPIVGATVENHGGSSNDVRTTTTNADGVFRLDNVFRRHDGHQLTVKSKGHAPQQLRFTPGTHEKPGEVAITLEPGHSVSGKVVNETGEPLSEVWIVADGSPGSGRELTQHTTSDKQGRFSFDSLSDRTSLDFTRAGYSPLQNKRVPLDGKDDVVVTLPDEGVLRGKVVDDETGKPISPFIVHITFSPDRKPNDPSGSLSGPNVAGGETFVEPDGTFRLGDLLQGMPLQVTVEAANYERKVVRRMVATGEKDSNVVDFRLVRIDESAFVPVGGQLLNEASKPVPNAELRLIVTSQKRPFPREDFPFNWEMIKSGQTRDTDVVSQFLSATTDAEGRFEFSQVHPGKDIELLWWGAGISQDRLAGIGDQKSELRTKLSIQIVTAGIVRGVIDPTTFPEVSDVSLMSQNSSRGNSPSHRGLRPAADGSYEIRDVPPGKYELHVYGLFTREKDSRLSNDVIRRIPLTVESGKTVTLDIGPENSNPVVPNKDAEPATSSMPVKPKTDSAMKAEEPDAAVVDPDVDIIVTGRVTDDSGTGLTGARLWLPLKPIGDECVQATTDDDGNYSLRIPADATRPAELIPSWTIWCYAEGRQIAAASAYWQATRVSRDPVDFAMKPASDTGFVVKTMEGKTVPNARVEPFHFMAGGYDIIPEPLRKIVGATTDEHGHVMLPAMGREGFYTVQVTAEGYGIQQLRLKDSAEEPAIRIITLRSTGRLEGRLISDNPEAIRNVTFHVYQDDYQGEYTYGRATVETDREGGFVVPEFAEGTIQLVPGPINPTLPLRPRIPSHLQVHAGDTTKVDIPYEATVRVRGRVQSKKDSQPVAGGLMSVSYGSFRQSEQVRTDADGRFEVNVLPGSVRQQLINRPDEYADWTEDQDGWRRRVNVPNAVDSFDLPPLELVENLQRTGRLLDHNNQPIADVRIMVVSNNRNYGCTTTDAQGNFVLQLPESVQIDHYQVTVERGKPSIDALVTTESPLVLQLPGER